MMKWSSQRFDAATRRSAPRANYNWRGLNRHHDFVALLDYFTTSNGRIHFNAEQLAIHPSGVENSPYSVWAIFN
jgi:hypothetical protein